MDKVLGDKIPEFNRKAEADEPAFGAEVVRRSAEAERTWRPR